MSSWISFITGSLDLGYEMSDEEKALQDGTHKLFREGEPAAQDH